jgi:predicted RecB family endonuclease
LGWLAEQSRLRIDGCLQWKCPQIVAGIAVPVEDNGVWVPDFDFVAVKDGSTAVVVQ